MSCLLLSVKIPGTLPYKELNTFFDRTCDSQASRNTHFAIATERAITQPRHNREYTILIHHLFDTLSTHTQQTIAYIDLLKASQVKKLSPHMMDTLYAKLSALRAHYLVSIAPSVREMYDRQLPIMYGEKNDIDHETAYLKKIFRALRKEAVVTVLNVLKNDILVSYELIINHLATEYMSFGCGFDEIYTMAIPAKAFVVPGQQVQASIFFASVSKRFNPDVKPDIGKIIKVEYGIADWLYKATDLGLQTVSGTATIPVNDDSITKSWSFQYMVGVPGISMQIDNMNTCYIGVPNPITIAVPGYDAAALTLRVPGASVTKTSAGHYNINITSVKAGKLYAFVDATNAKGRVSTVAGLLLLIKTLPPAWVTINDHASDEHISIAELQQGTILLSPDSFIDVQYQVKGCEVMIISKERNASYGPFMLNSSKLSSNTELVQAIISALPGDKLILSDIAATDNYGHAVVIPPAGFTVQ